MKKCPKCHKEIESLDADYEERGYCKVYEYGIPQDCNPDDTVIQEYQCPECHEKLTDDEAFEILNVR